MNENHFVPVKPPVATILQGLQGCMVKPGGAEHSAIVTNKKFKKKKKANRLFFIIIIIIFKFVDFCKEFLNKFYKILE